MAPDLVTIGGLTVDNVISADGRVALAQAGGNGAYSAVGALVWTDRVGLVSTAVESYPRATLAQLEAGGVDLSGVAFWPGRLTACSWFIYDAAGDRDEGLTSPPDALAEAGFPTDRLTPNQVACWRTLLSQRPTGEIGYSEFRDRHPLVPAQVPQAWLGARGVHLAPSQPSVMRAMLDLFGPDVTVTADPGWQLAARSLDEIAPLLARLDAFLPSEVELRALVPGAGLADGLAELSRRSPGAVAVKLGPRGALVWDRPSAAAVEVSARTVEAVDPTGAGDAFSGGFLAGHVETGDPVSAARFGALSASRIVSAFGADAALPVDRGAARTELAQEESAHPLL
ncbi:MAG: PfkB family carbohydrate kinase [Pseudomonadota bacterium]